MRKMICFAKRFVTGLMTAVLLLSALPSYVPAAEMNTKEAEEAITEEALMDEAVEPAQELPQEDAIGMEDPDEAGDADVTETDDSGEQYPEEAALQEEADTADVAVAEEAVEEEAPEEELLGENEEKIYVVFEAEHCSIEVNGSGISKVKDSNPPQYVIQQSGEDGEKTNQKAFSFDVKPDEGYTMARNHMPVVSCGTIGGYPSPLKDHESCFKYIVKAPEDPGYFTGVQTGEIKVLTITVTPVPAVNVTFENTGVANLKYRSGNDGFIKKLTGTVGPVVKGTDLYITSITPADGFTAEGATVKAGDAEETVWSADTPVIRSLGADAQLKVICAEKQFSSVAVTYRIDKKAYNEDTSNANVTFNSGVSDAGKTSDGDIVFSIFANTGYMAGDVSYVVGSGAAVPLEPDEDGHYVIDKAVVKAAEETKKSIRIDVSTKGAEFWLDDKTENGSVFATSQAVMGENGAWNFKNPGDIFTFTVTTPVSVLPKVMVDDKEADAEDSVIDAKYTKRTYTYAVRTAKLQGKTLTITDSEEKVCLFVKKVAGFSDATLQADGKFFACKNRTEGMYFEAVPLYKEVTLSVTAVSPYRLKSLSAKDSAGKVQTLTLKDGMATLRAYDDLTITPEFDVEPELAMQVNASHVLIPDKSTVSLGAADEKTLFIFSNETVKFTSVSAKIGNAEVDGFATLSNEKKNVVIHASAAADKGTKPVVVKLTAATGKTWTVNFTVAQNATSVTLKGFNKNTKDVKQVRGTEVSYAVTLNGGAAYDSVDAAVDGNKADVSYDPAGKTLTVCTYDGGFLTDDDFDIIFYRKGDATHAPIDTFTVHPTTAGTFAAPTVTLTSASDIDMTLSLSLPKALKDYENLFYHVEATQVDEAHSDDMLPVYEDWERAGAEPTSYPMYLMKAPDKEWGNGHAKKYDVKVTIIQVSDENGGFGESCESNCLVRGKTKELKKQSTKEPCFETKMSLTKKTTGFTMGEKDVLLAVAKFSKSTSYAAVSRAYLAYDDCCDEYRAECEVKGDGSIVLAGSDYAESLVPGKYTLYVWPGLPSDETYSKPATMAVTVKAPVTRIELDELHELCDHIYKAPGKAAGFTVKATCYSENELGSVKPADSKLVWTAEAVDPDSALNDFLTCKDGKVTIQKGYICSADPNKNMFKVIAKAADLGDDGEQKDLTFTVSADAIALNSLSIGSIKGVDKNPAAYLSTEFYAQSVKVNGNEIDLDAVTVSVTPATGLYISDGNVFPEKAGTYTVKVTAKDGSKKSISKKFAVKNDELDPDEPYVIEAYQSTGNGIYWGANENALTFDENDTAQADGATYLVIRAKANAKHKSYMGDVVCENKAKIVPDARTAKKMSYFDLPGDFMCLIPTSDTVKVKVSYPGGERMLTIRNNPRAGKLIPKTPFEFYDIDFSDKELEFDLEGIDQSAATYGWHLVFTPLPGVYANEKNAEAAWNFCDKLRNRGALQLDANKTKATFVLSDDFYDVMENRIASGKYNCCVTLVDDDNRALTNTVQVTFNVKDAPKPKALLNKTVTFPASSEGEMLAFKTKKDISFIDYADVMDPLENGREAKWRLSEYFEVNCGADWIELRRRSDKELPDGVTQMSGYIRYWAYGPDYWMEIECIDPITVKITE